MEKRNYNKKTSSKSIQEIFADSFAKMQNTKENSIAFREGNTFFFFFYHLIIDFPQKALTLNVSKTNIEPSQVLADLFSILKSKETEKTPELFDWYTFFSSSLFMLKLLKKKECILKLSRTPFLMG